MLDTTTFPDWKNFLSGLLSGNELTVVHFVGGPKRPFLMLCGTKNHKPIFCRSRKTSISSYKRAVLAWDWNRECSFVLFTHCRNQSLRNSIFDRLLRCFWSRGGFYFRRRRTQCHKKFCSYNNWLLGMSLPGSELMQNPWKFFLKSSSISINSLLERDKMTIYM